MNIVENIIIIKIKTMKLFSIFFKGSLMLASLSFRELSAVVQILIPYCLSNDLNSPSNDSTTFLEEDIEKFMMLIVDIRKFSSPDCSIRLIFEMQSLHQVM